MSRHHTNSRNMRRVKAAFKEECKAQDAPCWLCGQPIDYDAPHTDHKNEARFEVDHYHPASTHPEHFEDPANFRASHSKCNQARGNKAPKANLGRTSRQWM